MAEQQKKGAAGAKDKDELQTDAAPAPAAPADDEAVLVKRGEGSVNDGLFEKTEAGEELVTLGRDVVEEFYYPGTKRPAYRVLFTKGQVVRRSAIEQYNSALEGPDESNPLGIDSSTLASGTRVEPVKDDEGK